MKSILTLELMTHGSLDGSFHLNLRKRRHTNPNALFNELNFKFSKFKPVHKHHSFLKFWIFFSSFIFTFIFIYSCLNKADVPTDDGKSPFITARAVTTRTATTHEDLDTKAKTQQLEEKTVAHSMTSSATRQEQRTVTQEVKTTSMVVSGDQVIIFVDFICFWITYTLKTQFSLRNVFICANLHGL